MTRALNIAPLEEEQILKLCKEFIGPSEVFAACFYGPRVYGYADEKTDINVLLIIPDNVSKVRSFSKKVDRVSLSILAIDKLTFEADVKLGRLGEVIAEITTLPYQPWKNAGYFEKMEVKMKKRFILELSKNIVLQYPELSTELLIDPEYFMHEAMRRKAKLFTPSMYSFSNILKRKVRKQNVALIMKGYLKALKELETEEYMTRVDGCVKLDKGFIEKTKRQRNKLSNIFMSIQKALIPYVQGISKATSAFLQDRRLLGKTTSLGKEEEMLVRLEETEKYLLMPTPMGPIPLSDKTTIQDFVRKKVPGGGELKIKTKQMGSVLNSVFLLDLQKNGETQRIVVKKFEDWLGLKWFPLALWAFGTQSFAVLGATRLEREYAINQFMREHGFNVPYILYVSPKERFIFEEFVEGEKLSHTVKRVISSSPKKIAADDLVTFETAGRELAKVHMLGIALGDCKPENMLITTDGRVCFLDLEQATRSGNQPWDIAEFLYYSGHYILPTQSDKAARAIASSFLKGYIEAGGRKENVKKAASAKYTKVFSIFTLPHIIVIMANICNKMAGDQR